MKQILTVKCKLYKYLKKRTWLRFLEHFILSQRLQKMKHKPFKCINK